MTSSKWCDSKHTPLNAILNVSLYTLGQSFHTTDRKHTLKLSDTGERERDRCERLQRICFFDLFYRIRSGNFEAMVHFQPIRNIISSMLNETGTQTHSNPFAYKILT